MITRKKLRKRLRILYYWLLCQTLYPDSLAYNPYEKNPVKGWLTERLPSKNSAVRLQVIGRVTGVNYQSWLRRKARVHGLTLHAREKKRMVEVLLIGPGEKVESFFESVWKGPKRARVIKVKEEWFKKPSWNQNGTTNREEPLSWSQGTAERIKETLEYLHSLDSMMEKPNEFSEDLFYKSGLTIKHAALHQNLFVSRFSKSNYILSSKKEIGIRGGVSSQTPLYIEYIGKNKHLTKEYLASNGLPVPKGELFTDLEEARKYLLSCDYPLVVKPAGGLQGKGVTVDVRSEETLENAWFYAKKYHEEIVLEQLYQGVDLRIWVVGGVAYTVLLRIPAHIVGDGEKTVEELLYEKNKERLKNPYLSTKPIIVDRSSYLFMRRQGHSMDSTPQDKEVVFLHLKGNIATGGDSIAVTEYIHPDLMALAEEAARALSLTCYCGIDLLVERIDRPRDEQDCCIIEVNSRANTFMTQFPMYGRPANTAQRLMEHHFPEDTGDSSYPLESKRVEITGVNQGALHKKVMSLCLSSQVKGYVRPKGLFTVEAVVTGRLHHIYFFLDQLIDGEEENRGIIDGFSVSPLQESEESVVEDSASEVRDEDLLSLESVPITGYHPGPFSLNDTRRERNRELFLEEFKKAGYEAEPISGDLIRITKDGLSGITGLRHSSLFTDPVCHRIYPAKKILSFHGLPVPRGVRFKCSKEKRALAYFAKTTKPCLLTSLHPRGFKTYKVKSKKYLKKIWRKAIKEGTKDMLIEEHIKGEHIFVSVVLDEAVGAIALEPISIIGDGLSSIRQLIEEKNQWRRKNPFYAHRLIEEKMIKHRIKKEGYVMEDVLAIGERVVLESDVQWKLGGETTGIFSSLHPGFCQKAVEAVVSIPGLEYAVVYMVIPYPTQDPYQQSWVIKKIDTEPDVAMFHFPFKGEPCNLVERVVHQLCLKKRTKWF